MHKLTSGDSQESFVGKEKALNYGEQLEKGELSSRNLSLLCKQARKPRSYASSKLRPSDSLTYLGKASKKKREKSGQADRLGGGSPPSSLTASIL